MKSTTPFRQAPQTGESIAGRKRPFMPPSMSVYVSKSRHKERVREMKSICLTAGKLPPNVEQLTGFTIAIHPTPAKRRGQLPSDPLLAFRATPAVDSLGQHHV